MANPAPATSGFGLHCSVRNLLFFFIFVKLILMRQIPLSYYEMASIGLLSQEIHMHYKAFSLFQQVLLFTGASIQIVLQVAVLLPIRAELQRRADLLFPWCILIFIDFLGALIRLILHNQNPAGSYVAITDCVLDVPIFWISIFRTNQLIHRAVDFDRDAIFRMTSTPGDATGAATIAIGEARGELQDQAPPTYEAPPSYMSLV